MKKIITRRDFIKGSAFAFMGTAFRFSAGQEKELRIALISQTEKGTID